MKNNNKGFTLVEVILCIALLAIVVLPISHMLTQQSKSSRTNRNDSTVQQQALNGMAAFRTKCIPASAVTELKDSSGLNSLNSDSAELEFSKLVIKNNYTTETTTYEYDSSTKTLECNNSYVADGVEVRISPLPAGTTYKTCKGLKVHMISSIDDTVIDKTHKVDIENQFYFRNAEN